MPFEVVLDACALYPAHLRDTFLRLAERGLYRALWSAEIIGELQRSLIRTGIAPESVSHLVTEMRRAFPDSEVTGHLPLIDSMICDPKDRHVLAAAVRSNAAAVVTFNVADFPATSTDPFEVDVIHPDDFMLDLLDLAPAIVVAEIREQAAANRQQPRTFESLLAALERAGAPRFAHAALDNSTPSRAGPGQQFETGDSSIVTPTL